MADLTPSRRKRGLIVGGAVAAVAVAAAGYFALRQFPVDPLPAPRPRPAVSQAIANSPDVEALTLFNVKALSFEDALAYNRGIPVSALPNPAAKPFVFGQADTLDHNNAADCLTAALYYEVRTEPVDGQRAVAQVVLNRLRHPAYPKTVCGVVFQGSERQSGCQFSFTCDGALAVAPDPKQWEKLKALAVKALEGDVYARVGMATHYHANYVVPYWADSLVKVHEIGLHIFYRWTGGWGMPAAFTGERGGGEVLPLSLHPYSTTYLEALAAAEAAGIAAAAPPPVIVVAEVLSDVPTSVPGPVQPQATPPAAGRVGPANASAPPEPPQQWFGTPRPNGQRLPVPGS